MAVKTGISLKLDPELIKQLSSVAEREDRTLSNQISYFVKRSLAEHVHNNRLVWVADRGEYVTQGELS